MQEFISIETKMLLKNIRETYLVDIPLAIQDRAKLLRQVKNEQEVLELIQEILQTTSEYVALKNVIE